VSPHGPDLEALLTRIPLFTGLDRVARARLAAHLDPRELAPGETLCRQGEPGNGLYVVTAGRLTVLVAADGAPERPVASVGPGDLVGEMALLSGEPRSATVRAATAARVLRLDRERFLELVRQHPETVFAIARTLGRRLEASTRAWLREDAPRLAALEADLAGLAPEHRRALLDASLLDDSSEPALAALDGALAPAIGRHLRRLGADRPGLARDALRERWEREEDAGVRAARAEEVASRLAGASLWDPALGVLADRATPAALASVLGAALRAVPPLAPERVERWAARLDDAEAREDPDVALARAALHERQGDPGRGLQVLREALGTALSAGQTAGAARLSEAIGRRALAQGERPAPGPTAPVRVSGEAPPRRSGVWPGRVALTLAATLVLAAALPGPGPPTRFVALLLAAVATMMSRRVPDFAVALGLVAAWILLGLARPAEALAGFASREWLFVVAVYGLASAIGRSGLLYRLGLLLVRGVPQGLAPQAAMLLGTGVVLTPLIPSATGRASLVLPLAGALAEALRLAPGDPRAAVLGLAAWTGAAPLMFAALSGSSTCLLAWGLLPEAARARLGWGQWLAAAGPLALFLAVGALGLLFLQFRPGVAPAPPAERLGLQVALLGPPSRRERATLVILALTVTGWILAPTLHLDLAVVALLGLLAAVAVGAFDASALGTMDWNTLLFFGVVVALGRLAASLGVDAAAGRILRDLLGEARPGPLGMVLAAGVASLLLRLVLEQDLTVLLASLTLIPVATAAGVAPWAVTIGLLATSVAWFLPFQTTSYLAARSTGGGRLFSHAAARRFALAYAALTLLGLALGVPYWRFLGLL
jgi:CRP-like cAMP-binding protein/di/tricarboxylate transporter